MADRPEFVDLISDATRQHWRHNQRVLRKPWTASRTEKVQKKKLLGNWPPARFARWRLEKLTPWKLSVKSWTFKNWD